MLLCKPFNLNKHWGRNDLYPPIASLSITNQQREVALSPYRYPKISFFKLAYEPTIQALKNNNNEILSKSD